MKLIALTRGRFAKVDDEDFDRVSKFKWTLWTNGSNCYAFRYFKIEGIKTFTLMHRFILNTPADRDLDHEDGDGLNNQKGNLRECTQSQNNGNQKMSKRNRSGFRGVMFCKGSYGYNPWRARIRVNRQLIGLGFFPNAKDAARAYNDAALKHFGEFARLNPL